MVMMHSVPAIVVLAYNRPYALRRILQSLSRANYLGMKCIPLIISIDYEPSREVEQIANRFQWEHGEKQVITHAKNMGMRNHSLACGALTKQFGRIIFLEDDSYVAPEFFHYVLQATERYRDEPTIAGISLYNFFFSEFSNMNFQAIHDGFDNYFVQSATTWGVAWTEGQWSAFVNWFEEFGDLPVTIADQIPEVVVSWPATSWKKYINKYLVMTGKYFIYPRRSVLTNFADSGVHHKKSKSHLQVSLLLGSQCFRFSSIEESLAVYDAYFELDANILKKLNPALAQYEFEVDLYGLKDLSRIASKYVLTSRKCQDPVLAFGCEFFPPELNVVLNLPGEFFFLADRECCQSISWKKKMKMIKHNQKDIGGRTVYLEMFLDSAVDLARYRLSALFSGGSRDGYV